MSSSRTPVPHAAWTILRRDGVAIVLVHTAAGLPAVLHWGADLGPLEAGDLDALDRTTSRQTTPGTLDAAWRLPIVPEEANGWSGRPGLLATRDGRPLYPRWSSQVEREDAASVHVTATDANAGLSLRIHVELGAGGLALLHHELINDGVGDVEVEWLEATLPVPKTADHLTAFSGRWTREKAPLTTAMPRGTTTRESRRGRGGHDAPWVTLASIGAPRNRRGEAWAVHLGWSADVRHRTDRVTEHVTLLGAGELLRRGEVRLAPGESYRTPDGVLRVVGRGSRRCRGPLPHLGPRAASPPPHPPAARAQHVGGGLLPARPRPSGAARRRAADVGVERSCSTTAGSSAAAMTPPGSATGRSTRRCGRRASTPWRTSSTHSACSSGCGSSPRWSTSTPSWPARTRTGCSPTRRGPPRRASPPPARARPGQPRGLRRHVRAHMTALIAELGIDFIKWDHNRDLVEAVQRTAAPGTHAQTLAAVPADRRLKAATRASRSSRAPAAGRAPTSASSRAPTGCGRRTPTTPSSGRTSSAGPNSCCRRSLSALMSGPSPAHSSGRATTLSYRMATALQGSAGFEWDILGCDRR